ncbi:hypothetical protein Cp4444_02655 [Clostridium perfringens]|nr:hypothetical protein [Clostridium perfringens]MDH5090475.1 hypothetical protein [Clostridium perfringens]
MSIYVLLAYMNFVGKDNTNFLGFLNFKATI